MKKLSVYYRLDNYAYEQTKKDMVRHEEHIKKILCNELAKELSKLIELDKRELRDFIQYRLEFDPTENYKQALNEVLKDHSDNFINNLKKRYKLE